MSIENLEILVEWAVIKVFRYLLKISELQLFLTLLELCAQPSPHGAGLPVGLPHTPIKYLILSE